MKVANHNLSVKRREPKSFSSSSISGRSLKCPRDRTFSVESKFIPLPYVVEVQRKSIQPFVRYSKRCANPKVFTSLCHPCVYAYFLSYGLVISYWDTFRLDALYIDAYK
ncbi:hypothetical protein AVEN_168628-1 [Araneus ventricosus]|uniref:Uncharacterized protein n=1 Tax=Araneus ventricosus TaxID=182803 RepID=A0A4Y2JBT0_ARAVE|nr:hypothetical protein AVEN_168628-1 [Araneus ventricosus]